MKEKLLKILEEYKEFLNISINKTKNLDLKKYLKTLKQKILNKEQLINKNLKSKLNFEQLYVDLESEFLILKVSLSEK